MAKFISKIPDIVKLIAFRVDEIISLTKVKLLGFSKKFYTKKNIIGLAAVLLLIVCSCFAPSIKVKDITWQNYKNTRYGFEFPYPSNWKPLTAPANADGIAFVSPQNPSVEIRSWASNQLPDAIGNEQNSQTVQGTNFQTTQGVKGVLAVDVGNSLSTMTLTLNHNQVRYNWQGKSPSPEFQNYYPLFYYIVQQYRIPW